MTTRRKSPGTDLFLGALLGLAGGVGFGATIGGQTHSALLWLLLSLGGLVTGLLLGARVSASRP